MKRIRTSDGEWAAPGDSVSVPAYEGQLAVIVEIAKGCALLEFGTRFSQEWRPGGDFCMAEKYKGLVTADGYPVAPGMAVTAVTNGYAVHGVAGRPGWLDRMSGKVPVQFADGSEARFRGTDLYARDEEDLYLL